MKKNKKNEVMHVADFAFKKVSKTNEKQFEILFREIENFKNDFVRFIISRIHEIEEFDEAVKTVQLKIEELYATEGKVSKNSEKSDKLQELEREKGRLLKTYYYEKDGLLNGYKLKSDFRKVVSLRYNIFIHDDAKEYAMANILSSLERWVKGEGKAIHTHKYGNTSALQSKKYFQDNGGTRSSMIQFCIQDGEIYAKMWDLNEEYIEEQLKRFENGEKIKTHKWKYIKINVNQKDEYQKQFLNFQKIGNSKLLRIWKKNKYFYRVQIAFKETSKVVTEYKRQKFKVGIDNGTETIAVVREDGEMFIKEHSPDTPRVCMKRILLQQKSDSLTRMSNPERYREDGTVISNKEAEELGLPKFKYSKNNIKLKKQVKTLHALKSRKTKKNNEKTAKEILEFGNEFYIEDNNHKAWGMKRCRMSDKAKQKYDNGIRKSDYTKIMQNRAYAQVPARIKSVCSQVPDYYSYNVITKMQLSTYNHFSKENDIFLKLNDRSVTLNREINIEENDENKLASFDDTFLTIENNGKKYFLQRDLYAASKMLFCYGTLEKVEKTNKQGEKYIKEELVWHFDQERYEVWFEKVFYPKEEKYLRQLIKDRENGVKMSGTIFG